MVFFNTFSSVAKLAVEEISFFSAISLNVCSSRFFFAIQFTFSYDESDAIFSAGSS